MLYGWHINTFHMHRYMYIIEISRDDGLVNCEVVFDCFELSVRFMGQNFELKIMNLYFIGIISIFNLNK